MLSSTLDAILNLFDAINHADGELTVLRTLDLAELLDDKPAAVAIARALARDAAGVATAPPR